MNPGADKKTLSPDTLSAHYVSQDIRRQLQKILKSSDFNATRQQRDFLNYVVSQVLAGESDNIKGYTVAVNALGRGEDFDQSVDPIVSIQANKLRRALERYYLLAGKHDTIRIEIPLGGYVPVFTLGQSPVAPEPASDNEESGHHEDSWPTVVVKPLDNLSDDQEKAYLGSGFAAELVAELNRLKWVRVAFYDVERFGTDANSDVRFLIEGSFRSAGKELKVVVNLIDTKNKRLLWSDAHRFKGDLSKLLAFQEKVAYTIAAKLVGEHGIITRNLTRESSRKHLDQLTSYEAILRYRQLESDVSNKEFPLVLQSLEKAHAQEPDCGQICTFLARTYTNIFSLEIPGFDFCEYEKRALLYAHKGVRLNLDCQESLTILAYIKMLCHDTDGARHDIQKAYEMFPQTLYFRDCIGYLLTLLGDWETGVGMIRRAMKDNPHYQSIVHYALWLASFRKRDYKNAYRETSGLRRPGLFWYPLSKAATLGALGKIDEGEAFANDLLALKPDFAERGRGLIRRFIKFDAIADDVIEGLRVVGVNVK